MVTSPRETWFPAFESFLVPGVEGGFELSWGVYWALAPNHWWDNAEGIDMSMPNERTRAVIQTGEFLLELSRDPSLPERIRRDAKFLLRHYPDQFQMLLAGRIEEDLDPSKWPMGPVFSSSV